MNLDPYAICPCGSGKKFKWCCQNIHAGLDKAFAQHKDGQHEAALRTMDEIVSANSSNPEVYGRKALLLFDLGRAQEADQALNKAFQLNPKYPFGHFLRGNFYMAEGEIEGALACYRKAAEFYDPQAREVVASLYGKITEMEMRQHRPIAARAALAQAIHLDPHTESYRQVFEGLFGKDAGLQETAKREFAYLSPPESTPPEQMKQWNQTLSGQTGGRLRDVAAAFEKITSDDPDNAAGWYNLGLTRAWLGDNGGALEALEEYVQRETDEERAAAACTLAEILRCGAGVPEEERDYTEYSRTYHIKDGPSASELINTLSSQGRLIATDVNEENRTFSAILLQAPTVLVAGAVPEKAPRFAANLLVVMNLLRVWSSNKEYFDKITREIEEIAGDAFGEAMDNEQPANFNDILTEGLRFPALEKDADEKESLKEIEAGIAEFLEETWIRRPLHSLSGVPPIDAGGSFSLKKKLIGVVRFLEEIAAAQNIPYDFDRLRHKLGLLESGPRTDGAGRNIAAMSPADLAALTGEDLSEEELELAAQTAGKIDAAELRTAFLEKLVALPVSADKPDRFGHYIQLIQHAFKEGDFAKTIECVDAGEKSDCEHNEGRRRNDYELWRARAQAKSGEVADAKDLFGRLVERAPAELSYHGAAAEAMLSAKEYEQAARFAKSGLEQARKQQDRDSEGYFMELTEAAERGR